MMKKWMSITAAAVVVLVAANAHAVPILQLNDLVNPLVLIEDNQVGDSNPADGAITFIGSLGAWSFNVSTGFSYPALGWPASPHMDLFSGNISSGAGDLIIAFTDTDFSPNTTAFETNVGGTTGGTASFLTFLGDFNDPFGTDTLLAALGEFGPGPFSGTQMTEVAPSGSFSLTLTGFFSHTGPAVTSFDLEVQQVPEPATVFLLGIGMVGFAGMSWRRKM